TRRSVVVTADLRALHDLSKAAKLRGFVTAIDAQEILAEVTLVYAKGWKQDVEVSVENLPVDHDYKAHVQLLDAAGTVLRETWAPDKGSGDPDWWVNRDKYGVLPEVPSPWRSIEWQDGVAQVWGRAIRFGDALLPQQIVNQGQEILAAPIRLELSGSAQF